MKIIKSSLNWQGLELTYQINGETKHIDVAQECACEILKEARIIEDYTVFSEEDIEVKYEAGDEYGHYFMETTGFDWFAEEIKLCHADWINIANAAERLTSITYKEAV